jgi:sec-independent protein translocase protein TatB
MFNLGPFELVAIFIVALLVFGPDKLPEMGKQVGKAVREFRKFQASMQDNVRDVMEPITGPIIQNGPLVGPAPTNFRGGEIPTGNNVPRSATIQNPESPEGEEASSPGTFGHYAPAEPASADAATPQNGPAPTEGAATTSDRQAPAPGGPTPAGEAAPPASPADPDSR